MATVRPATGGDLPALCALLARAVADMNAGGNPQWDGDYPALNHYSHALEAGELYAAVGENGALMGAAVFNTVEAPEYAPLPWSVPCPALVIHKLVVDPACQRQGVGSALFDYGVRLGRRMRLASLRLDTYTLNRRMQALILKQGFTPVGHVHFDRLPLPYPCFELLL